MNIIIILCIAAFVSLIIYLVMRPEKPEPPRRVFGNQDPEGTMFYIDDEGRLHTLTPEAHDEFTKNKGYERTNDRM